jgi:hypothetical protein
MKAVKSIITSMVIAGTCYMMSCEKPGNVALPEHEPKLVLHGYIAVGDTFKIALGRTFKSEGLLVRDDESYVKNGWVLLYEGSIFLDSLKYNVASKRYESGNRVAVSGKQYTIRAGAAGFPTIEAASIAPVPIPSLSLVRRQNVRKTAGGAWLDDLTFSFKDPAVERNYYLAVLQPGYFGSTCVYSYDPSVELAVSDVLAIEETNCIDNDRIMYNDKTFNGSTKELTISTHGVALEPYTDGSGYVHRPHLKRYHVTEDYYRYFRNANQFIVEAGPGFFEPTMIKGNVQNGYGLFTIFAMTVDSIR